jgi:hypothetical protein
MLLALALCLAGVTTIAVTPSQGAQCQAPVLWGNVDREFKDDRGNYWPWTRAPCDPSWPCFLGDRWYATPLSVPKAVTVTHLGGLKFWDAGALGTGDLKMALYTDAGGVPGTMLSGSEANNVRPNGALGMPGLGTVASQVQLAANVPYWIVMRVAQSRLVQRDDQGPWTFEVSGRQSLAGDLPHADPWPSTLTPNASLARGPKYHPQIFVAVTDDCSTLGSDYRCITGGYGSSETLCECQFDMNYPDQMCSNADDEPICGEVSYCRGTHAMTCTGGIDCEEEESAPSLPTGVIVGIVGGVVVGLMMMGGVLFCMFSGVGGVGGVGLPGGGGYGGGTDGGMMGGYTGGTADFGGSSMGGSTSIGSDFGGMSSFGGSMSTGGGGDTAGGSESLGYC